MPLTLRKPKVAQVKTLDELAPNLRVLSVYQSDDLWCEVYSFNFKTNVVALDGYQHKIFEEDCVPAMSAAGGRVEMYGLADRTGSQKVNYDVSRQRLWYVQFLANNLGVPAGVAFDPVHKYFGEDYAAKLDLKDGTSSFYQRCVLVFLWPNHQSQTRLLADTDFLKYARSTPQP